MKFNYQISEQSYNGYHSDIPVAIFSEQDFTKAYEIYHAKNFNYHRLRVEQVPYARYFRAFHHTDIHKQTYSVPELENRYEEMIYFNKNRQFETDADSITVMSNHIPYNYDFYGYTSLQYLKTKYSEELDRYHESNFDNEELNDIVLIDYFEGWRQEHNLTSNIDIETCLAIEDSIARVSILGLLKGNISDDIKQKIIFPEGITFEMQQDLLNNDLGNKIGEFNQNVITKLQRLAKAEDTVSKILSPYQYIESRIKEISGNRVHLDQRVTVIISKRMLDKCKPKINRKFDVCKNQPKPITKYFTVYDLIRNINHKEFNKVEYSGKDIKYLLNSDIENILIKLHDVTGDYERYINRFRNNEDVKYYINEGINKLSGSTGTTVDEFLDKYIEHMDEISYTESEIIADYYLNIIRQLFEAISMTLPISPIKGYLATITANTIIPLIQSAIVNTNEESHALQQEAWVNFAVSSAFHAIFSNRAISRKIAKGAKLIENSGGYITNKFNIKKININYRGNSQLARESVKKIPGSNTNPWRLENIRNRYKWFFDRKYWSRFNTEKKTEVLQSHLMKTQEAKELAEIVGWEKLNKMIKDSITLDYEGSPINKISFRKLEDEVAARSYTLINDRKRINYISTFLDDKLTFSDQLGKIINVEDISGLSLIHISLPQILIEANQYQILRQPEGQLEETDLRKALSFRAQQNFGKLAQRITPKRSLNDLVISDALTQQLKEIIAAIHYRDQILATGFQEKIGYGTGISALFYGESGTGKTMAAEVIAGHLGVDLIKVDLSTVVNKYIGETEKNISRIFDLAEADSGVLFFDEADALFGKRSETKDAQDRHANIEVSYLLQRLESYPGLVILATNNRSHLDSAFNRRFTFITRFAYPDEILRKKMWQVIWPEQIKLSDTIDFTHLAKRADLTGANIRNIALLASMLAKNDHCDKIENKHINRAVTLELNKTGRLVF